MPETFTVRIQGEGVAPETLRLHDLRGILAELELALIATADRAAENDEDLFIALTAISPGSGVLHFSVGPAIHAAARALASAIKDDDLGRIPAKARQHVQELWKKTAQRNWEICLDPKIGIPGAVISRRVPLSFPAVVRGATSLLAKVLRVGGSPHPKARIELSSGEKITVAIADEAIAARLAQSLYQTAVLHGRAEWLDDDWMLASFKVTGIGDFVPPKASIMDALDDLREISGGRWDSIDPDEYLRELRSG